MLALKNEHLQVKIAEKGAEIQSVIGNGLEYIWDGDPQYWGKHSPVLFPIVGGLKGNSYSYKGKSYTLGRHGFARDTAFKVVENEKPHSLLLEITDTNETLQVYPFQFRFQILYTLIDNQLHIEYIVENTGDDALYFSVGAHPAFKIPLEDGLDFSDYSLHFDKEENVEIFPLDQNGQTLLTPIPFLHHTKKLPLEKSLFYKDALVFKDLQSDEITVKSDQSTHGVKTSFAGFPYMGIWSAKDADFVCIEPWDGIADNVEASGYITEKEGIIHLSSNMTYRKSWFIEFF